MPKAFKAQKLISVLATFSSVTGVSQEAQVTQVTLKKKKWSWIEVYISTTRFSFEKTKEQAFKP